LTETSGVQGRIKGEGEQLPRGPRDEIYLFQTKYSFEKFRDSEVIHHVALSIKGPQEQLISLQA